MSSDCAQRPIVIIDAKNKNIKAFQPQYAVLMIDNPAGAGKRYLDIGSLCYRRRIRPAPHKIGRTVLLFSLDNARIAFALSLIETLSAKHSPASASLLFHNTCSFIDWIDSQDNLYAFDNTADMKHAYSDYTQYLLHRLNSSGIRGRQIKQSTACSYQAAARTALICATGLSESEISGIATLIPRKAGHENHVNLKLPSADAQARTFASLVHFINEAHRLLINDGALPLHYSSPNGESRFQYTRLTFIDRCKSVNFSLSSLLAHSPNFPSWDDVKSHFGLTGNSTSLEMERAVYDNTRKRFNESDSNLRSNLRQWIGARAVAAGMMAFIAATGCNLSVAQNLEIDTLEFIPSTQGKRFSGTKARAGHRTVNPEFGAQFVPVFKKYLKLRQWVLNGSDSILVFPMILSGPSISSLGNNQISQLKACFSKALPKTAWVTPMQWRKNVSYHYVKLSGGDIALTAEKLGNTEDTVRQAYSRPALEDFAAEIANFLELMYQAAVDRTRTMKRIPVRVLNDKKLEAITGTGLCEKTPESQPERARGFSALAPAPACRNPETCLFCTHYAVHADEEDIRRLLSLRYLIHAIKAKQPIEHWQNKFSPTIHRIDEVISAIQDTHPDNADTIKRVRLEVERGELDNFWAIHFDSFVTLGAVS